MLTDEDRPWRVAVVPTRGDRLEVLARCLEAIEPQVHRIVLVDNSDAHGVIDWLQTRDNPASILPIWHPEQPPNLSLLWNIGIRAADNWWTIENGHRAARRCDWGDLWTAVLNDDAIVPDYWFAELMKQMNSASAFAGSYGADWAIHRVPGPTRLDQRMSGHAFVMRRGTGIYADEDLRWWCGDNDLDMQHRRHGGTLVLGGDPVVHLHPDESTRGVLAEQTGKDMAAFVAKWGFRPW